MDDDGDDDGDGLSDNVEIEGWQITIYNIDGTTEKRTIASNPDKIDTDGDGLNDYEEMIHLSDPTKPDTDGDGLHDYEEAKYETSPIHYDTWNITIRGESNRVKADFSLYGSSPTTHDTDWDGLSDFEEYSLGTNPSNPDTDGDGAEDYFDPEPLWNLTGILSLREFMLKKNKDTGGGADLYFIIRFGDKTIETKTWNVFLGQKTQLNSIYAIDFSDESAFETNKVEIQIFAADEDLSSLIGDDAINIDGSISVYSIDYDINESQSTNISTVGDDGKLDFSIKIIRV
jgi:hypothetical protein